MGYIRHHAIIVTGWTYESIAAAHAKACTLFDGLCIVSGLLPSGINGDVSFLVPPDGSKEGWEHSALGDNARAALIDFLKGTSLTWAEVQYYDDDGELRITAASCEPLEESPASHVAEREG